jgi:hypothetical protein
MGGLTDGFVLRAKLRLRFIMQQERIRMMAKMTAKRQAFLHHGSSG